MKTQNLRDRLAPIITNRERLRALLSRCVYVLFFAVALFMSVLNIITARHVLLIATGAFSLLCALNYVLARWSSRGEKAAYILFIIELVALFTYFIITGGTDNFSIIWVLLLPTLGLFFFGVRLGSVVSGVIFIIMLCCFHLPGLREITTDYGSTFRLRFPAVYLASYLVSLVMEYVRHTTQNTLDVLRLKYESLSVHDALTGLGNRLGLEKTVGEILKADDNGIGLIMLDIDHFKHFNDTYGHQAGDEVLRQLAERLLAAVPFGAQVYRWGGEEFIVFCPDAAACNDTAENIREAVRSVPFLLSSGKEIRVTVSIGTAHGSMHSRDDFEALVNRADNNMYSAKESGRDRIVKEKL